MDLILQNLTKRPNVRSTLILSRKDGSIIKASGSVMDDLKDSSTDTRQNDLSSASIGASNEPADSAETEDESAATGESELKVSRAQILASSIYNFVATATTLGSALRNIDGEENKALARDETSNQGQVDVESQAEDDVQLLRLRLKRQEVIVFPDPNYLCCVVQDLDKNSR